MNEMSIFFSCTVFFLKCPQHSQILTLGLILSLKNKKRSHGAEGLETKETATLEQSCILQKKKKLFKKN